MRRWSQLSRRTRWTVHGIHASLWLGLGIAFLVGAFTGAHYATFKVGGAHGTPVQTISVPVSALDAAKAGLGDHRGARDETPPVAPRSVVKAAQRQDAQLAKRDKLPRVFPDAAPSQRGCVTRLVQNYSSRNGVAPHAFILHYTVSPNVPGWADVNAVVGLFDTWAYQASSNYVIDGEGNCAYIVRETDKAWTQAAANPFSISVEVIATGQERNYIAPAGLRKLVMVISDALHRWHIPLQLGQFTNGVLTRPGILDHEMLGLAGGGHHDIAPLRTVNGRQVFDAAAGHARVLQVIAAVRAYRAARAPKPKPAWFRNASKLPPLWAWITWRDHGHPVKLRPATIPHAVPAWWWTRYATHVRGR